MNREHLIQLEIEVGVPRRRGDEPADEGKTNMRKMCSPQARG